MKLDRFEASNVPRRLTGRTERRGSQTGFPTWGTFAFGGIFVTVGAGIVLIGTRVIPVDSRGVHAPWWVLTVMGVVFALGGMMVWGMAWRQSVSERRRQEVARQQPDEPALADHGWDPRGFEPPRWDRAVAALGGAGFLTLFLSVFNWWAFFANGPWMVKAIVMLFDLILLAVWWEAGMRLGRALKFGGSRIEFARFPYRLNEPVVVRWQAAMGIVHVDKGSFTLRCVKEWFERHDSGDNSSAHMAHEEAWSGTWHLDVQRTFTRGEMVEARFDPPDGLPPTHLSADQPVFWEFEVKLKLPGLDFEEVYLVPVYAAG